MLAKAIEYNEYTEDELLEMRLEEAQAGLNETQQRFCENYVRSKNIKLATIAAGYQADKVMGIGYKLRKNRKCQRYIQWLKIRIIKNCMVEAGDIFEHYIRIAFADMADFVDIYPSYIKLKPADQIDGQLIKTIKSGRDGISVELHDKMKALEFLAKYVDDMPKDFKQILEERRVELMEHEFEFKKEMYEVENPKPEDDGFMDAIRATAEKIWE